MRFISRSHESSRLGIGAVVALCVVGTVTISVCGGALPADARVVSRPLQKLRPKPVEPPTKVQLSGPLQVVISLSDQKMTVFDQGKPIATSRVSTGRTGHLTPTGLFTIIEKRRFHRSNLYSNAPMPFMQRITYSGIALHEGVLPGYPASHGCIRMPRDFAMRLFGMSSIGMRVIVADSAVAPRAIEHPRLFKYRQPSPEVASADRLPEDVGLFLPEVMEMALGHAPVRTADASGAIVSRGDIARMQRLARQRSSPVSIFVSRKEGRLFARQRMQPMLEAPVTINNQGQPLGTHLFTALGVDDDSEAVRWNVVSMPSAGADALDAVSALEAIEIPAYATERLEELIAPGSSFIISDAGLGYETSKAGLTDFIVLAK